MTLFFYHVTVTDQNKIDQRSIKCIMFLLQTQKLQAEQLQYVKQSMRAAKEFDTDYQNTITELRNRIETALKDKQDTTQQLQREEKGNSPRFILFSES